MSGEEKNVLPSVLECVQFQKESNKYDQRNSQMRRVVKLQVILIPFSQDQPP